MDVLVLLPNATTKAVSHATHPPGQREVSNCPYVLVWCDPDAPMSDMLFPREDKGGMTWAKLKCGPW